MTQHCQLFPITPADVVRRRFLDGFPCWSGMHWDRASEQRVLEAPHAAFWATALSVGYHGTNTSNFDSIFKQGLLVPSPTRAAAAASARPTVVRPLPRTGVRAGECVMCVRVAVACVSRTPGGGVAVAAAAGGGATGLKFILWRTQMAARLFWGSLPASQLPSTTIPDRVPFPTTPVTTALAIPRSTARRMGSGSTPRCSGAGRCRWATRGWGLRKRQTRRRYRPC